MSAEQGEDACGLITEVAMEKAMERCGDDEAVKAQMARMLGVDPKSVNPSCDDVLEKGVHSGMGVTDMRRWVLCRAWDILRTEQETFRESVTRAWAEFDNQMEQATG